MVVLKIVDFVFSEMHKCMIRFEDICRYSGFTADERYFVGSMLLIPAITFSNFRSPLHYGTSMWIFIALVGVKSAPRPGVA